MSRLERYLINIIIFEIIILSGGFVKNALAVFLISAIVFFILVGILSSNRKNTLKQNLPILVFLEILLFTCSLFHSTIDIYTMGAMSTILSSFFIISLIDFTYFKQRLLHNFNIILGLSLFCNYILYKIFRISTGTFLKGEGTIYKTILYIFRVDDFDRFSAIYWEPGQLQLVIYCILCFYIMEISSLGTKELIRKFGIIFLSLFLTFSATAWITSIVFILLILINKKRYIRHRLLYSLIPILLIAFVYNIYSSDVIQQKFANTNRNSSYTIRYNDNVGLLNIIQENPIVGYGWNTREYEVLSDRYDNRSASNGWLQAAACCGIPFSITMLFLFAYQLKHRYRHLTAYLVLITLFISHCGEASIYLPCSVLYIFKFPNTTFNENS